MGPATGSLDYRARPRYKPQAAYDAHQHPGQLVPIYALNPPLHICKLKLYPIEKKMHISVVQVADYK